MSLSDCGWGSVMRHCVIVWKERVKFAEQNFVFIANCFLC